MRKKDRIPWNWPNKPKTDLMPESPGNPAPQHLKAMENEKASKRDCHLGKIYLYHNITKKWIPIRFQETYWEIQNSICANIISVLWIIGVG